MTVVRNFYNKIIRAAAAAAMKNSGSVLNRSFFESIFILLNGKKIRFPVTENSIIGKTAVLQHAGSLLKGKTDFVRRMGISAEGDDLTAKLPVTKDDFPAGVWLSKSVMISAGIQFNALACGNDPLQDFIQNILILFIRIVLIFVGPIPYHIINMAVKCSQIFQNGLEIFQICLVFRTVPEKIRIVGIITVNHMGGTDDKIKGSIQEELSELAGKVRLQAQFNTKAEFYSGTPDFF